MFLKMEVTFSSETSVPFCRTIRIHIQDIILTIVYLFTHLLMCVINYLEILSLFPFSPCCVYTDFVIERIRVTEKREEKRVYKTEKKKWQMIENLWQRKKDERKIGRDETLFVSRQDFRFLSHMKEVLYNTAHDRGVDCTRLLIKFISGNMATPPNTQNVTSGACWHLNNNYLGPLQVHWVIFTLHWRTGLSACFLRCQFSEDLLSCVLNKVTEIFLLDYYPVQMSESTRFNVTYDD